MTGPEHYGERSYAEQPPGLAEWEAEERRFIRCANGDRISTCWHIPRCERIPGHGFGKMRDGAA